MEQTKPKPRTPKPLTTADPNSAFGTHTAQQILDAFGMPATLLSTSHKTNKSEALGIRTRILYFTPGIFCPVATAGCLHACNTHSSGLMVMPTHATSRDKRTALFLIYPLLFLNILTAEITLHASTAPAHNQRPAVRPNGGSDIAWEILFPELFADFPDVQFYDYTKVPARMNHFLGHTKQRRPWPSNYHLTFSADHQNQTEARSVLNAGGNVAVVFWPELPETWWGFPVIDGDNHDARFLDPQGSVVGLKAKGTARVDLSGFTQRPCPECGPHAPELQLLFASHHTHRTSVHRCTQCGLIVRDTSALRTLSSDA